MATVSARRGDWIETFTGRQFWPLDPRPEDVCLKDIAHSLSYICRFTGHCRRFYSVAQHSLNCEAEANRRKFSPRLRLLVLLHDAAEAYIGDLARPSKQFMPEFKTIERVIEANVWVAFGIAEPSPEEAKAIKDVDNCLLAEEARALMGCTGWAWLTANPLIGSKEAANDVRVVGEPAVWANMFAERVRDLVTETGVVGRAANG